MIFWEDLLAASIFAAVPMWLVLRAWRRYRAVNWTTRKELFLVRSALGLLLLSLAAMVAFGVVVLVEEHLGAIRTIEKLVPSPGKVAIFNSSICVGSLLIASRMPKGSENIVRTRRSILATGIYLTILWLLIMTNPH